ncbi:arsenic resistance N-acetyltransferase ArsN2 [Lysobacter sp. 22409]|uniref:arsenic resistance N-acetyltransferase ArsN2 n=1 Tax=Lysobacter sp. 22409 TaxID=3453917 RepID=UPI003F8470E0
MTPAIRPLAADETAAVRTLLLDSGLPVDDLASAAIEFRVAVDENQAMLGVVGIEVFDEAGLLRSLAVEPRARHRGIGHALASSLEADARARGLRQLVLLTQTAEAFFARRGYTVIDRAAAPAGLQRSAEFRSLCPASAVCMRLLLEPARVG